MSEPSHRFRRLVATYSGAFFGLFVGTLFGSWWLVALWFVGSIAALLIAASRDDPDWPPLEGPIMRRM